MWRQVSESFGAVVATRRPLGPVTLLDRDRRPQMPAPSVPERRAPEAPDGRLAIFAPRFDQISQTFIYDHVRLLAPGRTVLVSLDSVESETFGCPVLSHLQPDFNDWGGPLGGWPSYAFYRLRRRYGPALAFDNRMRLREFLEAQKVTAVLAEYGPMGVLAADVCRQRGIPLHVYFHGYDASYSLRHPTVRRRYRRLFGQAASIICASRFLADRLVALGCPERLIRVVPCSVDTRRFSPGKPRPGQIVALGRLVEKKAPHLTIRAFGRIAGRFPQARLDIVGEGPLRKVCERTIAELGLEDRVTLLGGQPHHACASLMRRAAIFAQHSMTDPEGNTEGFPVSIAEAMATGVPVVSTRHSGIPEGVLEGITGLLVEEGDVDGMAEAFARLLADPALAARMGAAGWAHARRTLDQAQLFARLRRIIGLPEPAFQTKTLAAL
jgi:colanic acid/amylovoran biosynthesis glycosyltransferase